MEIRRTEIEQALLETPDRLQPGLVRDIMPIVWANYDQRRLHQFLSNGDAVDVGDHIDIVGAHYRRQCDFIRRVQETTDES